MPTSLLLQHVGLQATSPLASRHLSLAPGTQHRTLLSARPTCQTILGFSPCSPAKTQGSAQVTRLAGVPECPLTTASPPTRETQWCRHTSHSPYPRSTLCPIAAPSTPCPQRLAFPPAGSLRAGSSCESPLNPQSYHHPFSAAGTRWVFTEMNHEKATLGRQPLSPNSTRAQSEAIDIRVIEFSLGWRSLEIFAGKILKTLNSKLVRLKIK